jgi:short-subunit dehydrogenase
MQPYSFAGGTALLTGAAGGIGSNLARGLARRGSHLALFDINETGLAAVAGEIRAAHPDLTVTTDTHDLTDDAALDAAVERFRVEHAPLTLLVNNAGVALGGRFDQISTADVDWVMRVNFHAPMRLTHALLPDLLATPGSHLVNVSSLFGLIAPEGQTAYAASKFALRGLTEALRHELTPRGVAVSIVHPGGVRTGIAANARMGAGVSEEDVSKHRHIWEKALVLDPAVAAEIILTGVQRRQPRIVVGLDAKVPDVVARVLPGSYGPWLARATEMVVRLR